MTNLFSWLLRRFLIAFAILVVVQLASYFIGLNMILSGYEKNQLGQYERIAETILVHPESFNPASVPAQGPFFVFSSGKELIFSNKGKGKSIDINEYIPVYIENRIAGYFYAGELGFAENQSNRVFLVSIIILGGVSIVLSMVIGLFSAWLSSRRITEPINILRRDIHDIRAMKSIPHRGFAISEFAEMSSDIEGVSVSLGSQEEYKQQWLRDLAHDLRTPLSGLKAQLEAMTDGVLEPTKDRFRRQLNEVERLEALASSIGELTGIESRNKIDKTHVKAEHFVHLLVSPYEVELERKGILLETDIRADYIFCDEQLFLRAAGNILSNAVKYIGDGNRILVKISELLPEQKTVIEISNNGPDIPREQRDLVFTRLFRGDAGRSTPGSGLGLSITREIVKLHGGEVKVEQLAENGRETRGARFVVILAS